jgi:hypothetical protein
MTGVKVPVGVAGTSALLGTHAVKGTLPFTGTALTVYAAAGGGLLLAGLALRLVSNKQDD